MIKLTNIFLIFLLLTTKVLNADTIVVGTFSELIAAMNAVNPGDTILMKDGTYNNPDTWSVAVNTDDITITSQSGDREKVIVSGRGMNADSHHGFWVGANNVTISNITILNVRNHCIQTDINTDGLHVNNCILKDAGEYSITWDTTVKSCGIYLCILKMPDRGILKTAKVILTNE